MSRYAKVHDADTRNGPDDARPTALEIIEDEGVRGKLMGKVFVVTGVSSGIGIETMRALYATGAHVLGTVRNVEKGQKVKGEIEKSGNSEGRITLIEMELDNLASVKRGAESILAQTEKVNVLITNAGVMATPEGKTKDGFETQFGTNHMAHFYLFQLLKNALLSSASPDFPSRVVSLTSMAHRCSPIRPHDYSFQEPSSYMPWLAYGQSKTSNIYMSNAIERRYGARHLHSTSVHPGSIFTGLQVHIDSEQMEAISTPETAAYMKSPAQGAATTVYAAISTEWKDKGGRYLADCVEQKPFATREKGQLTLLDEGYETWAYDKVLEEQLWTDSLRMLGLEEDQ